ncbi:MAG: YicC/YloC family endoribonuclease [Pyrinomonadaceae bacterium]
MKSMTGYGRGEASGDRFVISIDIKTINNRFLDIHLRLPAELQEIEGELKRMISERLSRGRVDINLQFERTGDVEFELNESLVNGYISALKRISAEFSISGEPDLNLVARLPNALQIKRQEISEAFLSGIKQTLADALDNLESMRASEGTALKNDLSIILTQIADAIPEIEKITDDVADEYRAKLTRKIETLLAKSELQVEVDQGRIAQEVAIMAERSDISEEITRLKSHVEQFYGIMNEEGAIGKKLDFLTQELNRESNTIASKTNSIAIKETALNLKANIEKIREQIQNIE